VWWGTAVLTLGTTYSRTRVGTPTSEGLTGCHDETVASDGSLQVNALNSAMRVRFSLASITREMGHTQ
jgi:hypothetical protein